MFHKGHSYDSMENGWRGMGEQELNKVEDFQSLPKTEVPKIWKFHIKTGVD